MANALSSKLSSHDGSPSLGRLLWTLAALLVLASISWGIAHLSMGIWGMLLSLAIAFLKAFLVAWTFMELFRSQFVLKLIAMVTVAFIALLCAGVITDVLLR